MPTRRFPISLSTVGFAFLFLVVAGLGCDGIFMDLDHLSTDEVSTEEDCDPNRPGYRDHRGICRTECTEEHHCEDGTEEGFEDHQYCHCGDNTLPPCDLGHGVCLPFVCESSDDCPHGQFCRADDQQCTGIVSETPTDTDG